MELSEQFNNITKLYGSFSKNPGTFGYNFFNKQFKYQKINAIYIPFQINDIKKAIKSITEFNIQGVGISQPYKIESMQYIDGIDSVAKEIGSINTILNNNSNLIGYNTDWLAIFDTIKDFNNQIYILGNGGYAKAAFYACKKLNKSYINITRDNWYIPQDGLVVNCTPLIIEKNNIINANVNTKSGKKLAFQQACYQYKIYIGNNPNVSIY